MTLRAWPLKRTSKWLNTPVPKQIEADAESSGVTDRDGDPDIGDLVEKIVLVHNRFPPSSTALKLGNTKSLAVGASTVIRLQLFDRVSL